MKLKALTVLTAVTAVMSCNSALADTSYINMSGTADSDAIGITVLILDAETNSQNFKDEDIFYINQYNIDEDGSFSLNLPFFPSNDYTLYSNMADFELVAPENKTKILYVSDSGSDDNDGQSADAPLKTLEAAYKQIHSTKEIVLMSNTTLATMPKYGGDLTIRGNSSNVVLTLPSEVSLTGNLKLDNLALSGTATFFANGYNFKTSETITSDSRLVVYGGKKTEDLTGDTNITLLGGLYGDVFGGGYSGTVNGNTYVTLGGNANPGDSIDDNAENKSLCFVFGGGNTGKVTGKTNVTLKDNAIARYLIGAGYTSGATASETSINIEGGKVMNVYGGSRYVTLTNCNTEITMTGGVAEALFGGCENVAMSGNTRVNVLGGEVTRRVYTGCYNNTEGYATLSFTSDRYVTGTTTLTVGPDAKVNTGTGLTGTNVINKGLFAGSRTLAQHDAEQNTIIFLDGSYSSFKNKIGEKGGLYSSYFKSFEDYVINAGTGGKVYPTSTAGTLYIVPDAGNYGQIGTQTYINKNAEIMACTLSSPTNVTFAKDFSINSMQPTTTDTGIKADLNINSKNAANESEPKLIVAVYDDTTKKLIDCSTTFTTPDMTTPSINIDCTLESGNTYLIKAMLWNASMKPLTSEYKVSIKK